MSRRAGAMTTSMATVSDTPSEANPEIIALARLSSPSRRAPVNSLLTLANPRRGRRTVRSAGCCLRAANASTAAGSTRYLLQTKSAGSCPLRTHL
jgi:hypothetical protein